MSKKAWLRSVIIESPLPILLWVALSIWNSYLMSTISNDSILPVFLLLTVVGLIFQIVAWRYVSFGWRLFIVFVILLHLISIAGLMFEIEFTKY